MRQFPESVASTRSSSEGWRGAPNLTASLTRHARHGRILPPSPPPPQLPAGHIPLITTFHRRIPHDNKRSGGDTVSHKPGYCATTIPIPIAILIHVTRINTTAPTWCIGNETTGRDHKDTPPALFSITNVSLAGTGRELWTLPNCLDFRPRLDPSEPSSSILSL